MQVSGMLTSTASPMGVISSNMPFGEGPFRLLARASPRLDIEEAGFLSFGGCLFEAMSRCVREGWVYF